MSDIDLGWYNHKKSCIICKLNTPENMCVRGRRLRQRFFNKGKYQQKCSVNKGHREVIGFVEIAGAAGEQIGDESSVDKNTL